MKEMEDTNILCSRTRRIKIIHLQIQGNHYLNINGIFQEIEKTSLQFA